MFEVGFSELCMVALVALLVIGPERLPSFARIAGYWLGKARTMVANAKAEIRAELETEELRQLLQAKSSGFQELQNIHHELTDIQNNAEAVIHTAQEQTNHET